MVVRVFVIFLKIGEIDNIKERYQADAYIESCWEDDNVVLNAQGEFDPTQNWEPEIFIENAVGNLKQEIRYKVEKKGNKTRVMEMRNVKGCFWERLELWDFPLDVQGLSITVTSAKSNNEVRFEPSLENECAINTEDFRQQQEWNLYSHLEISKKVKEDLWKNYNRPCYTVSSTVSRKPGYFIYNAYMLIFFISTLGFTPFSFQCTSPHFRIQTTCLMILSSVNFRWIVTQKLPTVSYLTTLDKYAVCALIFLVCLCAWHAVIGSSLFNSMSGDERINVDIYVLIGIASFYVLFHLLYIILFLVKYRRYKDIGPSENNKKDDDATTGEKSLNFLFNQSESQSELQQKQLELHAAYNSKSILKNSSSTTAGGAAAAGNKVSNRSTRSSETPNGANSEIKYRNLMESPQSTDSSGNMSNSNAAAAGGVTTRYNVKIKEDGQYNQQFAGATNGQNVKRWRQ